MLPAKGSPVVGIPDDTGIVREVPASFVRGQRPDRGRSGSRPPPRRLVGPEVEGLVLHDLAADGAAELVQLERRLLPSGRVVERVIRVHRGVAQELERGEMELVAPRTGRQLHQRAGARRARAVVRRLDRELLERVRVRQHRRGPEEPVVVVRPVHPEVVLGRAQPVDRDGLVVLLPRHRRAGGGDGGSGRQRDQLQGVAAVQGQLLHLPDGHGRLDGGRGRLDDGCGAAHLDRRFQASGLHGQLQVRRLPGDQVDVLRPPASGTPGGWPSLRTGRSAGPRSGRCRPRS